MKIFGLTFLTCVLILFSLSCVNKPVINIKLNGFVKLKNGEFQLNGKKFYPVILNYLVAVQTDGNKMWISPSNSNEENNEFKFHGKEASVKQFKADMQMIKDIGFNGIRFGFCESTNNQQAGVNLFQNEKKAWVPLTEQNYSMFFNALSEVYSILDTIGLKAIVMLGQSLDDIVMEKHIQKVLANFKNEEAIMAYDFFNEPLYFDQKERKKEEVYKITKEWKAMMETYSPKHLFTIGLTGPREVFEWDPNILNVDFISIHPYEFRPNEVENEMYWFGTYCKKPWIIGETGFSADGDSVSYDLQKEYSKRYLNRAVNCGAKGFSWWQYKDVSWFNFQSNFLGLLTQKGTTQTSNPDLTVNGTPKPATEEIKNFNPEKKTGNCDCLPNYYNYENYSEYSIKGILKNKDTDEPIAGGTVVAWNENYGKSVITFTKSDGSFELYANYKFYHFIISATRMSVSRTDFEWDKVVNKNSGKPVYDIGVFELEPISLPD